MLSVTFDLAALVEPTPHKTVLSSEVVELLQPRDGGVYVDGTLGYGGHAEAILNAAAPSGQVIGIDRDSQAIEHARQRLHAFGDRFTAVHDTFGNMPSVLAGLGHSQVDGIVLDVGVSSPQLDQADRGFSFTKSGPIDMRMDPSSGETALALMRRISADELGALIKKYGEERYARRIATRIKEALSGPGLDDTVALAELVADCIPAKDRRQRKTHPATKTFQALRVAVNGELDQLEQFLAVFPDLLVPGGRCAVISFHSLEDRLVKRCFRDLAWSSSLPPEYAEKAGERVHPICRVLTRKPTYASDAEVDANPRARSARLRACEKLEVPA